MQSIFNFSWIIHLIDILFVVSFLTYFTIIHPLLLLTYYFTFSFNNNTFFAVCNYFSMGRSGIRLSANLLRDLGSHKPYWPVFQLCILCSLLLQWTLVTLWRLERHWKRSGRISDREEFCRCCHDTNWLINESRRQLVSSRLGQCVNARQRWVCRTKTVAWWQ